MKQTESEINRVKSQYSMMWKLVDKQLRKAFLAVENNDKELAKEILIREKKVNAQELLVDSLCENFIALFAPVAIDLRFVIAMLKINNNLERIGDFAENMAMFVLYHQTELLSKDGLMEQLRLKQMMNDVLSMIEVAQLAFDTEDASLAVSLLAMDERVDEVNQSATKILANYIRKHPDKTEEILQLSSVIRRIERAGDRVSNIAEEIVFYIDAKEIRHQKR